MKKFMTLDIEVALNHFLKLLSKDMGCDLRGGIGEQGMYSVHISFEDTHQIDVDARTSVLCPEKIFIGTIYSDLNCPLEVR